MARARAIETLSWLNNTVHPTFTHVFMPHKYSDQPAVQAEIRNHALPQYRALIHALQARVMALPAGEWLAGVHLGPVDAYALTATRWATMAGIAPTEMPDLWAYVQRVAADHVVQRVIERERLTLNMHKPCAFQARVLLKSTVNKAPGGVLPGWASSIVTLAPCLAAISITMGRPSPEPSASLPKAR